MKSLIVAAVAVLGLAGCVAVPAPYYSADPYYYPAPAVGVGIYSVPGYRDSPHWRHHHRHHRHWRSR
jgi:hypothetical protein